MTTFTSHSQRKFDSKKCRDSVARNPTRNLAHEILRIGVIGGVKIEGNYTINIRLKKEPKKKSFSMGAVYHHFLNVYKGLLSEKLIFNGYPAIETKRLFTLKNVQNV